MLDSEGIQVDDRTTWSARCPPQSSTTATPRRPLRAPARAHRRRPDPHRCGRPRSTSTRPCWARPAGRGRLRLGVARRPIKRSGMTLDVRMPHHLTFLADGQRDEVTTTAIDASAAPSQRPASPLGPAGPHHAVLQTRPSDDQVIAVTRVAARRSCRSRPIKFDDRSSARATPLQGHRQGAQARARPASASRPTADLPGQASSPTAHKIDEAVAKRAGDPDRAGRHQAACRRTRRPPTASTGRRSPTCESGGNPKAYNPAGPYYGLYQFSESTWHAVGGVGLPIDASPSEQTYRAQILYNAAARASGRSAAATCSRDRVTAPHDQASLLGPAEVRALAARLGIRPTKTLGQNFVIDPNTVRRIVRAAEVTPDDVVLEVGPGLGSLTLGLLPGRAAVIAVEIDPVLAGELPGNRGPARAVVRRAVEVVTADALRIDGCPARRHRPGREPALQRRRPRPAAPARALPTLQHGLVMVQAEVAERLAAPPGQQDLRRAVGQGGVVRRRAPRGIGAGATSSGRRPTSTPACRRCTRRAAAGDDAPAAREVFALVDAAFAQRRKTLRAALRRLGRLGRRRRARAASRRHRPADARRAAGRRGLRRLAERRPRCRAS